jgi:hypothetical protein
MDPPESVPEIPQEQRTAQPTSQSSAAPPKDTYDAKAWILQYSQQEDEDSEESVDDIELELHLGKPRALSRSDISTRYRHLSTQLRDAKSQANDSNGSKFKSIQGIVTEMKKLEKEKNFDAVLLIERDATQPEVEPSRSC